MLSEFYLAVVELAVRWIPRYRNGSSVVIGKRVDLKASNQPSPCKEERAHRLPVRNPMVCSEADNQPTTGEAVELNL